MLQVTGSDGLKPFANTPAVTSSSSISKGSLFREVLASAQGSAADSIGTGGIGAGVGVAVDAAESSKAATIAALNAALSQAGISIPPALRIYAGANGVALMNDNRDGKFQAMLNDNPALKSSLSSMVSQQEMARKAALKQVVTDFLGKSGGGAGMAAFVKQFLRNEDADSFSISYNGSKLSVDELGKNGWEPVKDKDDFTRELIAAYTKFQTEHAVTVEKRKDEDGKPSDADLQLRAMLAKLQADDLDV